MQTFFSTNKKKSTNSRCIKNKFMKEEIERGFTFGGIVGLSGVLHHGCSANSLGMNTIVGRRLRRFSRLGFFVIYI